MYSKSFIYKILICIIVLMLFDISLIYDMTADIYKRYLKIAILVAIGCHLDLYLELSKQEILLIQAFKNDTFNETYELLNTCLLYTSGINYSGFAGVGSARNGVTSVGASGKERQVITVSYTHLDVYKRQSLW